MREGMILQPLSRIRDGHAVIQLFGRLATGEAFLVEDDRFRPYFFVPRDAVPLLPREANLEVRDTRLRSLEGTPLASVVVRLPGEIPPLRQQLAERGVTALEADVRFPYRYLIDRGIRAAVRIDAEPQGGRSGPLRFHNPRLLPGRQRVHLRTLSIDLETSPDASRIFSVALASEDGEEVHLVSETPVPGARVHPDERALLEGAGERIQQLDPDVLTGWNVVDFDLRVWQRRCHALGVPVRLGRVPGDPFFHQDPGFARQSRVEIPGRVVLDGIPLVRDAIRLQDYRLETAARTLLGRGKLIDNEAPDAAAEIERLYREDPKALVAYNLEDARLVLEILEHEGLLELAVERSLLTGMQLDRVGASVASFDLLYLPELRRRGYVAPSVDRERQSRPIQGGAVLDSEPGIFDNVAVFDFKSLYPSLIRTFHLDPLAHARATEDPLRAPNGACFHRQDAILPEVIERLMASRTRARRAGRRHADQAIKIMMNALFGVLATPTCRFFNPEIANAITGFGQQTLAWTRAAFEDAGVRVLYGDTDSVFVKLRSDAPGAGSRSEAEALRKRVEARIGERIRQDYAVEPRLELELERVFERFFLPRLRGRASGSKKRYAGWAEGRLELVGLESVRRDWPAIAGRLQKEMLRRVFRHQEVVPFVKELVDRVLSGELDEELAYVKRVRKGSLDRYTATTPPHIQAARKAGDAVGPVVRYVMTRRGPEPLLPGRPPPSDIDRRHYVERVLRPVAESILTLLDQSFDEALGRPRQLSLL